MKHFTSAFDTSSVSELIDIALYLKKDPYAFESAGKRLTLGMMFQNPSLRTRLSTTKAAQLLGLEILTVNAQSEGWALEFGSGRMDHSTVEHVKEAASVMGEYCDLLAVRSFPTLTDKQLDRSESQIIQWMNHGGKPFISLESATLHPLQSLADMMTIREHTKIKKPKVVLTWAPHVKPVPQAVANSFCEWMQFMDAEFVVACPDEVRLDEQYTHHAVVTNNQTSALQDADFVYVKSWSMFQDYGKLLTGQDHWMLTSEKLSEAGNPKVMHCLPVRRDVELSSGILDSASSIVISQAANRVPAAQAVLLQLIADNYRPELLPAIDKLLAERTTSVMSLIS